MDENGEIKKKSGSITNFKESEDGIAKEEILSFCPKCGRKIEWLKGLKYCIYCRNYLIPYISRKNINEWLASDPPLTDQEINELYKPQIPNYIQIVTRKPWDWKSALGIPFLGLVLQLILGFIFIIVLIFTISPDMVLNPESLLQSEEIMIPILIFGYIATYIFLLLPYAAVGYYLPKGATKRDKFRALGIPIGEIGKKKLFKEILIGIVFAFIMTGVVFIAQELSTFLTELIYQVPREVLVGSGEDLTPPSLEFLIFTIILMFISIGPSEEILFRGFSQKGFERSMGKKPALIVTALYFTLFHIIANFVEPWLFFYTFIPYMSISLILGFLFYWRDNVIACIISHALYNSFLFILAFFYMNVNNLLLWIALIPILVIIISLIAIKITKSHNNGGI
jgi:membrane protease YdiL (CAAX protease family)